MMIQRICATLFIAIIYFIMSVQGVPKAVSLDSPSTDVGVHATGRELSSEAPTVANMPTEYKDPVKEISVPGSPLVAQYSGRDRSWTFIAEIVQLKDVSIYGRPGTIAQVEYMRDGQAQYAWTVVKIDDYYFSENIGVGIVGQEIVLEVSGEHVSSQGVNWDACPRDDLYCAYASFIEGGFPKSEDYNALTICPSNALIYSGHASDDWINGMLAWKIKIAD